VLVTVTVSVVDLGMLGICGSVEGLQESTNYT